VASTGGWVADPEIDAAFDELSKAETLSFGGVGFANIEGPATTAFYTVRAAGPAYLAPLQRLLDQATPAGRVYAATLLTAIDKAAGRRAWERLATQHDTLNMQEGCPVFPTQLSRYAIERLAKMGVDYVPEASPQFDSAASYPAVDSVTARQAIVAAFHGRPRIVFVTARDEQQFVGSLFPDVQPPTAVYVSRETRDGRTRGPHFDLYQAAVHRDYPFVATLNLVGAATVESTVLDRTLASYYFKHYPQPTETAYTARRLVSALTLSQQRRAALEEVRIGAGVGMIIPQRDFALPVVHDVRPDAAYGPASYGLFLKFIVPRPDDESLAFVEGQGFTRWKPGTDWYDPTEVERIPRAATGAADGLAVRVPRRKTQLPCRVDSPPIGLRHQELPVPDEGMRTKRVVGPLLGVQPIDNRWPGR
jgi:hypothetical protein